MIRAQRFNSVGSVIKSLIVCTSVLVAALPVGAATISYGNVAGSTVVYQNVTESSGTDAPPLFGAPSIFGDTLDFNPIGFTASSSGGGAPDITDGQLNFTIKANSGYIIPFVNFSERGDFTLAGTGTALTYASVSATVFIDILEVDGVTITPLSLSASLVFSPVAGGGFTLPGFPGPGSTLWTGSLMWDVNASLTAANIPFLYGATKIDFALDNTLVAASEAGSSAFIAKKDFKGLGITVFNPNVPEPSVLAITLCGGLLVFRRFRRA